MPGSRLLSATLAALLLLGVAGGVLAQTPPPIERTPEMEEHAAELAALFPDAIGDVSLMDNLEIDVGQELIGEMDPSDPEAAAEIAQLHDLAAAAGATLDDLVSAVSYAQLDEDAWATVIAIQIRGSDSQPALPLLVAAFQEDLPDALVEEMQIGDVPVTSLSSAGDPEAGAVTFLSLGDIVWLLAMPPDALEETIGSLPGS